MEKILQNKTIFKPVTIDDNLINLSKFQNFLYRLRKINNLKEEIYHQIRPISAATLTLYGVPKLHKDNTPLRPILLSIGSYSYETAVWLNKL